MRGYVCGVIALILFLAVSCASSAQSDPWQEYKSRELARIAEFGEPESFYSVYEGSFGPAKMKLATWMLGTGKFRLDNDMGIMSVSMGFDGENAWIQTKGGKPRALSSAEEKELFSSMYFDSTEFLTDETLKYEIAGTEDWGGVKVWQVKLESPEGHERDLFISDRDWEIAGYRVYGTSTVLVKVADVTRSGAMAVPGKVEMELANLNLKLSFNLIEAREGVEIDPKLFLMPQGKYAPLVVSGDTGSATLNLQKNAAGMLVIDGLLDGKSGKFLLDTGASSSILDSSFIKGAKITEESGFSAVGVGGAQEAKIVRLETEVSLGSSGEVTLPDEITYMSMDLSALTGAMGESLAGIIGEDLLTRAKVRIDFVAGTMTVTPYSASLLGAEPSIFDAFLGEAPKSDPEKGIFPIFEIGGLILVDAFLGDGVEERFIVDTGFHGMLGIFEGAVKRLGLDVKKPRAGAFMGGIGGVTEMKGVVSAFSAGFFGQSYDFTDLPVISGPIESVVGGSAAGIVGVEFFEGRIVEFDYSNKQIRLLN